MNKCYFQRWEESERGWGTRPDGCSLHLDDESYNNYIKKIYSVRESMVNVPSEYDRAIGSKIDCFVSDDLFLKIQKDKSIRLMEHTMNNLMKMDEIFFKP